jgi:hypothetical protein
MEIIFLIWLCARDHELNSKQDKLFFLFSVNFFPFRKKQAVAGCPHAQTSAHEIRFAAGDPAQRRLYTGEEKL